MLSIVFPFNSYRGIFGGVAGALIHSILIVGAHCRSRCLILIWMIFAWMDLVFAIYVGIKSIYSLAKVRVIRVAKF